VSSIKKRTLANSLSYGKAIIWSLIIAFIVKGSIAEAYRIPSSSMEDTLLIGDFVVSNKIIFGATIPFTSKRFPAIREPQQNDIVTFIWPGDMKTDYVKRVVATAGQVILIKDKVLTVDGEVFPNPKHAKFIDASIHSAAQDHRDNFGPYTVPRGYVFVMGDNRDNSYDSRFWGPLDINLIRGKVMFIQWSIADDESAPKLDIADIATIPETAWHTMTHFIGRIRWDRTLDIVH